MRSPRCLPLLLLLLAAVSSCARSPRPATIRICDESGCSDRPVDSASFDPSADDPDPDGRMAALEALASEDPRAAYDLGLRLFRGDGVRQDSYQALQWMRRAAEGGDLEAQKAVGRFYLTGLEEMGPDPREAQKWLRMAADQGDSESEQLLEEANAARASEEEYDEWTGRWRPVFHRYWYHDYPYRWHWRDGGWYY